MHTELSGSIAGSAQVAPVIELNRCSKWYGNVIGVNNLTLKIFPGITGVLGPNGAGKSTLLQLMTGQLSPSQGEVRVLGQYPWNNAALNRFIGLCPEQDAFYEWMTGFDFVFSCAKLSGIPAAEARIAAERSIERVHMSHAMNRPVKGYSKGMRQRTKIAQALVHDPQVLFLDEPLTGTDPVARRELVDIIISLGKQGKSILISSHVLYEVQSITSKILVLNHGKLIAEGNVREIRDLIDKHPHRIILIADEYRMLAGELLKFPDVLGVDVADDASRIVVETNKPDIFYSRLTSYANNKQIKIHELYSEDDNLESIFKYLVNP